MPSNKAFVLLISIAVWLGILRSASAAQWNIVQYNIVYLTASTDKIDPTLTFTDTTTVTLQPPVTAIPSGRPTSIETSYDAEEDALYTTVYIPGTSLPSNQFASLTQSTFNVYSTETLTEYSIDKVYTAPASCPSHFIFTTSSILNIPYGAGTNVSPTSATTTTNPAGNVYVIEYLAVGAVTTTSSSITSDFVYDEYIAHCTTPISFPTGSGDGSWPTGSLQSGGGDDYYNDDYYGNCLGTLCPFWLIYIVVIVPVLGLLFLGGLFESYYWFTRLMKGQSALRGVPLMWVAISLWTLCCLRRHRAAQPEVQAQLFQQWREMSSGQRIKLWLSYGFRHRDPPQLAAVAGKQPIVPVWQSFNNAPGNMGNPPPMQSYPPQQWQGAPGWTSQNGHNRYQTESPYPPPPTSLPPQFQGYSYLPPPQQQMQQAQQKPAAGQPVELFRGSSVPSPATSPSTVPGESLPASGVDAGYPIAEQMQGTTLEIQQPVPLQPPQHVEAPTHPNGDAYPGNGSAQ